MSYIDVINQAATASTAGQKKNDNNTSDIMGKEDFLSLLVAQLKNQDPLNPDEPTEFTAQLAQFSSLEQLFNINDSMNTLSSSVSNSQKLSALSLIGKEVTYADSKFSFEGAPVRLGYSLDGQASDVTLHLKHQNATIATLKGSELDKGDHFITWSGLTKSGTPAPVGDYTIVVEASAATGSVAVAPLVRSEVTGVDLVGKDGGLLYTKNGEVGLSKIKGVFEVGAIETDNEVEPASSGTAVSGYNNSLTIENTGAVMSYNDVLQDKFVFPLLGPDYAKSFLIVWSDGRELFVPDSTKMVMNTSEDDVRKYQPGGQYSGNNPDIPTMEVYAARNTHPSAVTIYY